MRFEIKQIGDKIAIFEYGKQISDDFDDIYSDGLAIGTSNYFIARKDDKEAIYEYQDGQVKKLSDDFDAIDPNGLVAGTSNYFVAIKDGKWAIYKYQDGQVKKLFDDFDEIYLDGLLEGTSNYFVAKKDDKKAIYEYQNGQVKKLFDDIYSDGLVKGESNYFIAKAELKIIDKVIYILIDASLNSSHYSEASHQGIKAWRKAYEDGEGTPMNYEDEIEDEFLKEVLEGYKEVEAIKEGI